MDYGSLVIFLIGTGIIVGFVAWAKFSDPFARERRKVLKRKKKSL